MASKYEIWFNGKSNADFGIKLQGDLQISAAVPNVEVVSIAGRNGDLVYADGTFKNRTATVSGYIYRKDMVKAVYGHIVEWLFDGGNGYKKLVTSDDLEHFMLARVKNAAEVVDRIRRLLPFEIVFDCKPQRFLVSGEEKIELFYNTRVENPTIFTTKPLYKIYGSGSGYLTVNGSGVNAGQGGLDIYNLIDYIYYDAESDVAWYDKALEEGELPPTARIDGDLSFGKGENYLTYTGDIVKVEVIPRWWEL